MKRLFTILLIALTTTAVFSQTRSTSLKIVKEFDVNGNLIRLDSIYTENNNVDPTMIGDSALDPFGLFFLDGMDDGGMFDMILEDETDIFGLFDNFMGGVGIEESMERTIQSFLNDSIYSGGDPVQYYNKLFDSALKDIERDGNSWDQIYSTPLKEAQKLMESGQLDMTDQEKKEFYKVLRELEEKMSKSNSLRKPE